MTFDARETSIENAQPIRLYRFTRGLVNWHYTGADTDFVYGIATYESIAIQDEGIRQTGETSADEYTIRVPSDLPVVAAFRTAPPAAEVGVTVWDTHYGETEARIAFVGVIRGVRRATPETALITCQSDVASLERPGLRLGWERGCTHTLYDIGCKASPGLFGVSGLILSTTGATITAGAWAVGDGYFAGGYVQWPIGGGEFDRRGIEFHAGSTLTLIGGADSIPTGIYATAYPGCSRKLTDCNTKFSNAVNYGGFTAIPGKSPFDGDAIM